MMVPEMTTGGLRVSRGVTVAAPRERAFEVFTTGFDSWWPRVHRLGAADLAEAVIEPFEGGRWYERTVDGAECTWGRVVVYDVPHRIVLTWQIDADWKVSDDLVTHVEVTFEPDGPDRTRVELVHRGLEAYADRSAEVAASIGAEGGWGSLLEDYARAVSS
jgi:uncharacterized protein YndB with AHSA1/START domain